jgi:hypothetical protein
VTSDAAKGFKPHDVSCGEYVCRQKTANINVKKSRLKLNAMESGENQ